MKIGIIGAGSVGMALAYGFAEHGHEVFVGTRDPGKDTLAGWLAEEGAGALVGSYEDAAAFGDVVVFAVPGRVIPDLVEQLEPDLLAGKVIIDPSNPIVVTGDGVQSAFGEHDSGAETLQRGFPAASVVKAFNQIPALMMARPAKDEQRPLRIAGDDPQAKAVVTRLAEEFGWTVRDLGDLKKARALEMGTVKWMRDQR